MAEEPKQVGNLMTLDEAMDERRMVTLEDAERECRKHTLDPSEVFAELGDHP